MKTVSQIIVYLVLIVLVFCFGSCRVKHKITEKESLQYSKDIAVVTVEVSEEKIKETTKDTTSIKSITIAKDQNIKAIADGSGNDMNIKTETNGNKQTITASGVRSLEVSNSETSEKSQTNTGSSNELEIDKSNSKKEESKLSEDLNIDTRKTKSTILGLNTWVAIFIGILIVAIGILWYIKRKRKGSFL